jgi:periplasmic protein TonB
MSEHNSIDDLLFKNRNKEYGAYKIRKLYNKTLALSLLFSVLIVLFSVLLPFILNIKNQYSEDFIIRTNIVAAELMPIDQTKPNELKPQPKIGKTTFLNKPENKSEVKTDSIQKNKNNQDSILEAELKKKEAEYQEELIENKAIFSLVTRQAFSKWVDENFNRNLLLNNKHKGTIILQFTVNERGIIDSAKVIQSLFPVLDNEAKRVILSSPRWKPFIYKGHKRKINYIIPVNIIAY